VKPNKASIKVGLS